MKTFKVIHPKDEALHTYSEEEFEKAMGITLTTSLKFQDDALLKKIQKLCEKASQKNIITTKQKWLGQFYAKEIRTGAMPDITFKWVGEHIGYGVFTNKDLLPDAYIGEYTGLLRRRRWLFDRHNHYRFVYSIGENNYTRYIIDAEKCGNHCRFINHSDVPNLEPISVYCDGVMHIILCSSAKIPKGSQLTYDYGDQYWTKRKEALPNYS